MNIDTDKGIAILSKYCKPQVKKLKGKTLILALVEVAGCPHSNKIIPSKKCNKECYDCWHQALLKQIKRGDKDDT